MSWQRERKAVAPGNIRSVQSVKANADVKKRNRKEKRQIPQLGLHRCGLFQ